MSQRIAVFVDARCLQDPRFQFRGVGSHVASLLRSGATKLRDAEIIGLIDPDGGPLPDRYRSLFSDVSTVWNPALPDRTSLYIASSPMTHDCRRILRFASFPRICRLAVVFDFIPMDWPGYFQRPTDRMDYLGKLAWLKQFHVFAPISGYTQKRLGELVGVVASRSKVTGIGVRSALAAHAARMGPSLQRSKQGEPPYILTVGGDDRRKNMEAAIKAVRLLRERLGRRLKLKCAGHFSPPYRHELEQIAGAEHTSFLEFVSEVGDERLAALYGKAAVTVVSSHIEGFSMPVVEAAVCGSPAVASMCAAHMELVDDEEALFVSNDSDTLAHKLNAILNDAGLRDKIRGSQASLSVRFSEEAVGSRFWQFAYDSAERQGGASSANISIPKRPRIAFLSPYPPDRSGVAKFTEQTIKAAVRRFDVDIYSDASRPLRLYPGMRDGGPINLGALRRGPYNAIVSVIGNSHFHTPVFEIVESLGGPCILHDSRLTQIYHHRYGRERFRGFASDMLGRPVSDQDIDQWLRDQNTETVFVEKIIERARPLFVHTPRYRQFLHNLYGVEATHLTFPPNLLFNNEELSEPERAAARERLGLSPESFVIGTFGFVIPSKGYLACIVALELLRSWGIPAELHFVGSTDGLSEAILHIAREYGISEFVHFNNEFVPVEKYRDFLKAADAGIQLRTYDFGQPSAALADCISAGLPSVAPGSLADSCESPSYVSRIGDQFSPLLIAEALAGISGHRDRGNLMTERTQYCDEHSFEVYVDRLAAALELT